MKLYHFTCAHSAPEIKTDGFLRPWPQPVLANATAISTGLTGSSCCGSSAAASCRSLAVLACGAWVVVELVQWVTSK